MKAQTGDKQYKYDLFLSHSAADKEWTEKLATAIESDKDGTPLHVYFAEWDLPPGGDIPNELEKALKESRHIGLVLSPESLASGWVSMECSTAIYRDPDAKRRTLIPLLRRECEIPEILKRINRIDFRSKEKFQESLSLLIAALRGQALRPSTAWTNEEINTLDDIDSLRRQAIIFNRPAFKQACILELFIPELSDAIDDTQAALNTGALYSRKGTLQKNVPESRSYKTPRFKDSMRKISDELTQLKRMVTDLQRTLRELDPSFEHQDFGHIMYTLTLKHKYGYGDPRSPEDDIPTSWAAFRRIERIHQEIDKLDLSQEDLESALKELISIMDTIDEKRNDILRIVNSLLQISGDEQFPMIRLSSQAIKDNDCGLVHQLREQLGGLALSRLGLADPPKPASKAGPIKRVFILEGCIACGACQAVCPEVFSVDTHNSLPAIIKPGAEAYFETHRTYIEHAAAGCCTGVIKIEYKEQT